jgi:tetratricopeptide (TPR) repeat protein
MNTHDRAIIFNDLANAYAEKMRYTKAIYYYKEALSLYIFLAKNKPTDYGLHIANVFSNLSAIYLQLNKVKESDIFHQHALKMHRALVKCNPNKYAIKLARCLVDGVLYLKQHSFTLYEAEMAVNKIESKSKKQLLLKAIRRLHIEKNFNNIF